MSLRRNGNAEAGPSKKRRLPGACDLCKKRKIRCDGSERPNGHCTNCTNSGVECTHVELTKNLGSAKGSECCFSEGAFWFDAFNRYVEGLEYRLEKMEMLLNKLLPGVDTNNELDTEATEAPHLEEESIPRNDLDETVYKLEKLDLETPYSRYYGKASGLYLVETALQHKEHHTGKEVPKVPMKTAFLEEFWEPPPTHAYAVSTPEYDFPEEDLMNDLIDLYFVKYNCFVPLLHRPTFERSVKEGQHLHDHSFGGILLLVCALAARYSDDPRVFLEGPECANSAGWQWIRQVPVVKVPYGKPSLYDLQAYALAVPYLQNCTLFVQAWTMVGFGLRLAQDVGAHSQRGSRPPNAQDELWKRAFFALLFYERALGNFFGRQPNLHEDEYNVDLPLPVDDEFWDCTDPKMNFKQPPGKPSSIAFFGYLIKLSDIMSYAQRMVYSLRKPNIITGKPNIQSEHQIISDLDSALNSWLDSVPEHLKWDPSRPKDLFFEQSASLWILFYKVQIMIHKPFIPTPKRPSSLSFPSLTICTTAARACSHIARVLHANNITLQLRHVATAMFSAAVVILLNTWTGKRSGTTGNMDRDQADLQSIMDHMKQYHQRWPLTAAFGDIIMDLAKVSHVPIQGHKRRRSAENLKEEAQKTVKSSPKERTLAGSRRASSKLLQNRYSSSPEMSSATTSSGGSSRFPSVSSFNFSPELPGLIGDFSTPSTSSPASSPPYLPGNGVDGLPDTSASGYSAPSYSQQLDIDTLFASLPPMNDPAMSVWSSTQFGIEMQDWAPYFTNFDQVDQTTPGYQNQTEYDASALRFW
ncbi:hypothetical protein E1B28_000435 [Marasmius oreades]|uniref:Zn(2)-C6 fungal-type domain-containing protein n=1 Tax=Marasmius oreades TaxID=181124 RepID=A0A9P7V1F6_9AGAR|nr:uncharacterized protein E1B28_000435 [Marasmius oreades]KAG7098492.1 hypothetical protein E1B28_000435 [Marasmius oreades]